MDDLLLWRVLAEPEPTADVLVPLLEGLRARSPERRLPWLGRIDPVLGHPHPGVRAAALRLLGGVDGYLAHRRLVEALDDGDARVREAALDGLAESAQTHPARWVHAMVHAKREVRRSAVSRTALPPAARRWRFALIADPEVRDAVLAGDLELDAASIGTLLAFLGRGLVSPAEARRLLLGLRAKPLGAWALDAPRRTPEEATEVLASEGRRSAGVDALDPLIALFVPEDVPDDDVRGLARLLGGVLGGATPALRTRVVAALARTGAVAGRRPLPLLEVLLRHHPVAVTWTTLARASRRAALEALPAPGRVASAAEIDRLARGDLVHLDGGTLDLLYLGFLLRLKAGRDRYGWAADTFGVDAIAAAFAADPARGASFLAVEDPGPRGRGWMLGQLLGRTGATKAEVQALLVLAEPPHRTTSLSRLAPRQGLAVLAALLGLVARRGAHLGRVREDALAGAFGHLLVDLPEDVARVWLGRAEPEPLDFGARVFAAVSARHLAEPWAARVATLPTAVLRRLLPLVPFLPDLGLAKELALAAALERHPSPPIAEWAAHRAPPPAAPVPSPRPLPSPAHGIAKPPPKLLERIAPTHATNLARALRKLIGGPHRGLTDALAKRTTAAASLEACVALLGAHDPVDAVATELARHGDAEPSFQHRLARQVVAAWLGCSPLPLLGNAWLHRWERHAQRAMAALADHPDGLGAALDAASRLRSREARIQVFRAAARALSIWRWRDRARIEALGDLGPVVEVLVSVLDTELGVPAAQALKAIEASGVGEAAIAGATDAVRRVLPDCDDATREVLRGWFPLAGLPSRARAARAGRLPVDEDLLSRASRSTDLEQLARWCRMPSRRLVEEAAIRLATFGERGCAVLAALLDEEPVPPELRCLTSSVLLWPDGPALDGLRRRVAARRGLPEVRFRAAMMLVERGEERWVDEALAALKEPLPGPSWLGPDDLAPLGRVRHAAELARELAESPHPHAYRPAVDTLCQAEEADDGARAALRAFLDAGDGRYGPSRLRAAQKLAAWGDLHAFPLLLADRLLEGGAGPFPVPADLLDAVVDAARFGGAARRSAVENQVVDLIASAPPGARDRAYARLLADARADRVRARIVERITPRRSRDRKLQRVAETFAWGVEKGRELTGRLLQVHMTSGTSLGHTRLTENRVHVTVLPLLREERHARTLVEALLLHEIGHQRYHRSAAMRAVWSRGAKEGLSGLLNLVMDEHLERNLRALRPDFGDRLKVLAAYAFQHARRDLKVADLFAMLQEAAFPVLSRIRLGVSRDPASVRVDHGPLLQAMERSDLAIVKFARALRMGLGRRHGDGAVDAALALFGRSFRRADADELLRITLRLRDIFGAQARLLSLFGGHETLEGSPTDELVEGEGLTDGEVQREVERILRKPSELGRTRDDGRRPRKDVINVGPDPHFTKIHRVVKVPPDPAAHRAIANAVRAPARHLRRAIGELGLRRSAVPRRLEGRRLDRGQLSAVVTRGDPRMLVGRRTVRRTDLYLGLLVDCSSSMRGPSIERARAFGVLVVEAVAGLAGVELGLFGFTERVIYDAGDAARPAVASLRASGGNNDAAALFHVAQVAKRSRRRAKVLVMVSDGLPTECSVLALRTLVQRLTRREGMLCAQVAVRPLEEVCFPHYVLVDDGDYGRAVRRFGRIVQRLVQAAQTSW
ncbi:MAG: hypothetical protein ACFCGT_11890 [Sandaracinaceae bacterium]